MLAMLIPRIVVNSTVTTTKMPSLISGASSPLTSPSPPPRGRAVRRAASSSPGRRRSSYPAVGRGGRPGSPAPRPSKPGRRRYRCRRQRRRLHRLQHRLLVLERLVQLDGARRAVLRDDVAAGQRLRRRVLRDLQRDEPLAEEGLRQEPRRDVRRNQLRRLRLEREGQLRAVVGGDDVLHRADDQPAHLDVGLLDQLVADLVGLELDRDDGREGLVVERDGQRHPADHHGDEQQAEQPASERPHPAILTVTSVPQMANPMKKFMIDTVTMERRTALPTATPTPAGPPVARYPK